MSSVYIVHCVDTEGPLYESLYETFERLKNTFGYEFEPSLGMLKKLQNREINLNGDEEAIAIFLDEKRLKTNGTWHEIDEMLDEMLGYEFRMKLPDSNGKGWVYNWFCMDHVGFTGYNPRRRDAGYHNIFDYYSSKYLDSKSSNDLIQFHYHPIPFSGDYNCSAISYVANKNLFEILARKVIDKKWFPCAYRPGFHTERPDSHWFLEQWIPFDYANQSVSTFDESQPDMSNGRFGDWRRATKEWDVYHPSHDDYQIAGNCRRWIARCLNMNARTREINLNDFREGFERARSGKPTIISFANHDFRDMRPEIDKMRDMISKVKEEYPDVKFYYSNAIDAMRKSLNLIPTKCNLNIQLERKNKEEAIFKVKVEKDIFGPQPFLAIKTITGEYYWDNFDFDKRNSWTYTLDAITLKPYMIEKIGVAINSKDGVTEVGVYNLINDKIEYEIYNENL